MGLPVIITLTTIPPRFHQTAKNIEHTLKNLKLTDSDYKLVLNCPRVYQRFKENESGRKALKRLTRYKKFIFNEDCEDLGPITKIIPTLQLVTNQPSILIICDDEKYHIDAFKKMIRQQNTNFSTVYSYWVYNYPKGSSVNKIQVPQGVDMISVYSPFMSDFGYYYQAHHKNCKLVDDLIFGYYFKQKGVPVKQLARDWKWAWIPTQMGTPSLFNLKGNESRVESMNRCYNSL